MLTKTIPNKSGQQENEGEGEVAEQEQDDEEAKQKSEEKAAVGFSVVFQNKSSVDCHVFCQAIAAIQRNQAQLQARARQKKDVLAKRAETLQKAKELQKSKQELLQKLIDEQKLLISKVTTRGIKFTYPFLSQIALFVFLIFTTFSA